MTDQATHHGPWCDEGPVSEVCDSCRPICGWFLLCENPAEGVIVHPIIGDVPACQRCADKAGEALKDPFDG